MQRFSHIHLTLCFQSTAHSDTKKFSPFPMTGLVYQYLGHLRMTGLVYQYLGHLCKGCEHGGHR